MTEAPLSGVPHDAFRRRCVDGHGLPGSRCRYANVESAEGDGEGTWVCCMSGLGVLRRIPLTR